MSRFYRSYAEKTMELNTIRQLKKLQAIRPYQEWAALTKKKILKEDHYYINEPSSFSVLAWFRQGWVLAALMLLILTSGSLVYLNFQNKELINDLMSKLDANNTPENKQLVSSLNEVNGSLKNIKSSLDGIKSSTDKQQILSVASVAKATAKNGRMAVQNLKEGLNISDKVKASLAETEKEFEAVELLSSSMQQELLPWLLNDYKQRTLNDRDKNLFTKAEQDYQNGLLDEAMTKIFMIGAK